MAALSRHKGGGLGLVHLLGLGALIFHLNYLLFYSLEM